MQELEVLLDVKHRYTTLYYPRCSSLVESFNGTCQKILFKLVDAHPRDWDEYLVYGKEAVVPLEVMLPSLQFYQRHVGSVEEQHEDMLLWMSLLDLSRDEAI